jgi:hypothetical protein
MARRSRYAARDVKRWNTADQGAALRTAARRSGDLRYPAPEGSPKPDTNLGLWGAKPVILDE